MPATKHLCTKASWVQDIDRTQKLVVILKRNKTIFALDSQKHDLLALADCTMLTKILQEKQWPREDELRELIDSEEFLAARALRRHVRLPPLIQP